MIKRLFRFLTKLLLWFVALSFIWVLIHRWVPVYYTSLMAIRSFQDENGKPRLHDWVALDSISDKLQLAVIAAEDQGFQGHHGFDFNAIRKAMDDNRSGKRIRGGSTISQQTAKNVFLWPDRTWLRKGLESWFTVLIEICWSKQRILEVYLNSIEMGPGVYGAEAAAQFWFNRSAHELNSEQSAAIAAILPNPRQYKAWPQTNYLQSRSHWILRQMNNLGPLKWDP